MRPGDKDLILQALEDGMPFEYWPEPLLEIYLQDLEEELSSFKPSYDPQDEESYKYFVYRDDLEWQIWEIKHILHPVERPLITEEEDDEDLPF